ncbi:hypothetical protein D9M68_248460 [compost metagenome]
MTASMARLMRSHRTYALKELPVSAAKRCRKRLSDRATAEATSLSVMGFRIFERI